MSSVLNINRATYAQLINLPGIGPKTAQAILEYRDLHGDITPEILSSIPYIRFSNNLISLLDFSIEDTHMSDERDPQLEAFNTQQQQIDSLTETIDRASLSGPPPMRNNPYTRDRPQGFKARETQETRPTFSPALPTGRPEQSMFTKFSNSRQETSRPASMERGSVYDIDQIYPEDEQDFRGHRPSLTRHPKLDPQDDFEAYSRVAPSIRQSQLDPHDEIDNYGRTSREGSRSRVARNYRAHAPTLRGVKNEPGGFHQSSGRNAPRWEPARESTAPQSGQYFLGHQPTRKKIDNLPKSLSYDGRGNWQAFYTKFTKYAEAQRWSARECRDYLCWCLEGKASEYYALLEESNTDLEYFDLLKKFERRFGFKEIPETAQISFQSSRQSSDEVLDDWADRVMNLATMAFRNLPDEYMYQQAILRFCHGCVDKDAGESVANTRPITMEDAIDRVKWAVHTRSAVHGRARREVKLITCDGQDPYVCNTAPTKPQVKDPRQENDHKKPVLEHRMSLLEKDVDCIKTKLDLILSQLTSRPKTTMRSPSPKRTTIECFGCQGNHFVRDCPNTEVSGKNKSVSFLEENNDSENEEGSEEQV